MQNEMKAPCAGQRVAAIQAKENDNVVIAGTVLAVIEPTAAR